LTAFLGTTEPETAFELRGVGLRFRGLRLRFGRRDANQLGALDDLSTSLDRRGNDTPLNLGGYVGFFFGSQRAGDLQVASDRLLRRSSDRHADRRRRGGLCFRLALRCTARRRCECDGKREHGYSASDRSRLRLAIGAHGLGTTRVCRRPGANATQRRFNRITDQGVRIDIGLHAIGYTQCGDADHWSEQ
jgi:hypothetical protein